ncbi:extracellular solute-binding protein [Suttonella sp. R2A3]|uniref:extracellular solute-binding protein n=1 Tax=Suttonella sp. R2A3 TaxID=2908648 RepID=UPI001F35932F|nr:extracellular solute-binding protein [Suttonella sp. R2A3]UJF23857.1 extracellular solute-binding protein [Suttonella sp. R2A3]
MRKFLALSITMAVSGASIAATNITWWHAMGGQLGDTVNKISSDFNAAQEACTIEPVYKGSYEELLTSGVAAFRAKQAPNIIQVYDAGAATIINAKGAVIPVTDLFAEADVAFDEDDYIAGVRNFYADSDGKMIGMPFNSSTPILYYNKDALAEAGVEPPKTWEDFETIAPKLKEAGYIGFSQSHTPWIFAENFHSRHNLQLADEANGYDAPATHILYNNPDMKMHFSKLKEWKDNGYYGYYGEGWGDNQTPFEKGEVAMWLGSSGSFGGVKEKAEFDFGTTYLPYWNSINDGKEYNTFIGGAALFAFNGYGKEQNACTASFFKFLSQSDTQAFWHKETGYVPITNAAYDLVKSEGYYDEEPAAETGILQLNQSGGEWTKGYRLGFYPQIREVMRREFTKFFNGDVSVDDAFATIESESDKLLARFAQTVKE